MKIFRRKSFGFDLCKHLESRILFKTSLKIVLLFFMLSCNTKHDLGELDPSLNRNSTNTLASSRSELASSIAKSTEFEGMISIFNGMIGRLNCQDSSESQTLRFNELKVLIDSKSESAEDLNKISVLLGYQNMDDLTGVMTGFKNARNKVTGQFTKLNSLSVGEQDEIFKESYQIWVDIFAPSIAVDRGGCYDDCYVHYQQCTNTANSGYWGQVLQLVPGGAAAGAWAGGVVGGVVGGIVGFGISGWILWNDYTTCGQLFKDCYKSCGQPH